MSRRLVAQQQALVAALADQSVPSDLAGMPGIQGGLARGLQAYRINAQVLSGKALAAVFPQLRQLLGEASFEAMAWAFWRAHPPALGDLAQWGGALADFLAAQDGMEAEPLDLARLEWALHRAEAAADVTLDAASLTLLAEVDAAELALRLRPGVQVLAAQSTGPVLVWRQGWQAHTAPLTAAEAALMQALLDGLDLENALSQASAAGGSLDVSVWLQAALRGSWLHRAERVNDEIEMP